MEKKSQIYEFIRTEIEKKNLPPTIREIGRRFNISSTNGVRYFLNKLEEDGLIKRQNWTARGIKMVEKYRALDKFLASPGRVVPLVGRVPAGRPLFSAENVEDKLLIDESLVRGEGVFAVKVNGESMIGAGINDGDIAIVKPNPSPMNGDIVVALIDDEVTLKRFVKKGRNLILKPENECFPEINLSSMRDKQIKILGTVSAIMRKY